jgi:phospholipid/cholesterol/gamma-HCH transport system permease protein
MLKNSLYHFGKFVTWLPQIFKKPENFKMYWNETMRQMEQIGLGSFLIVFLISIFIGAVTAVQFAYQLTGFTIPRYYVGYIVRDMTLIEMAPTITCLVLAGKVGSNIASEIGGMRQKEHIAAMEIMGVNTSAYLTLPRLIACIVMVPVLVAMASFFSMIGAYLGSVPTGMFTSQEFTQGLRAFFDPHHVTMMLVKALVFGIVLCMVSCYQGYHVKGGSVELGKASTQAVVISNILILLSDYLIAVVLT